MVLVSYFALKISQTVPYYKKIFLKFKYIVRIIVETFFCQLMLDNMIKTWKGGDP